MTSKDPATSFRFGTRSCKFLLVFLFLVFAALVFVRTAGVTIGQTNEYVKSFHNIFARIENDEKTYRLFDLEALTEKVASLRQSVDDLSCKVFGIASKGGFCLSDDSVTVGGNQVWNVVLAQKVESYVGNGSLLDLGAGLGFYGRYFVRKREPVFPAKFHSVDEENFFNRTDVMDAMEKPRVLSEYEGYDGAVNVERYTTGFIKFMDLSEKQILPRMFDFVMSLEVGEHIPAKFETVFLDNLARHACRGIVMSWAVEGQGGHFHVNNHNNDYIEARMAERGFRSCPRQDQELRRTADLGGGYWFKNTLMLYLREVPSEDTHCQSSYPEIQC